MDLPADHYSLIISDHGASWPGIGPDEGSDDDVLDLAQIVEGIASGLEQAGIDKLDLLGFDACLMGGYEVASAVAPLADRLVASQELMPGHGFDYTTLAVLADATRTTADQFGQALVEGFSGQAEDEGTDAEITMALVDLTKMAAVDDALNAFASALAERGATVGPVVGRANAEALEFAKSPDETEARHLKDLGQLASAIGVEALDVSDQAVPMMLAPASLMALTRATPGWRTTGRSPISARSRPPWRTTARPAPSASTTSPP